VEAINAGGTSYYTGAFTFTTVPAAPAAPGLVLPASAAVGVNRLTRFVWNSSINASKYQLQVGTDNQFATVVRDTTVLDTTLVLANPLNSEGDYYWHVNAQNFGGAGAWSGTQLFSTGTVLGVDELEAGIPQVFDLQQNYPNPFNPSTIIRYDIPSTAFVKLVIYDVLGREVATLANEVQKPGRYQIQWHPTGLSTGVYFYRMEAKAQEGGGSFTNVKKLLFVK
jgi:hypothetical protein